MALGVRDIDGDFLVKEKDEKERVSVNGREVQDIVALRVREEGIGAVIEEEVDDVVVAALGSPHRRCSDRLAASGVDFGTRVEEEFAEFIAVVYCCPLQ